MASFDSTAPVGAFLPRDVRFAGRIAARRFGRVMSSAALVCLFLFFAAANFSHWRSTGAPSGLGITVLEAWVAALFVVRRQTLELSRRRLAWIAAPIGSFAMLLARPGGDGLPQVLCEVVQLSGVLVVFLSLATLGRSFGIVAANRGVKTRGPYRFVRHPAYMGYLICYLGYVAENPRPLNFVLLFVSTSFQLIRISEEERVLGSSRAYRSYREAVRYRLVPSIY